MNTINLTPYDQEKKWLALPEALCTYYIRGKVICASASGYYMYSLPISDREFFRFGQPEDITQMDDASDFCTLHREELLRLDTLTASLRSLGLAAVAITKTGYILSSLDGNRYFSVAEDDAQRMNHEDAAVLLQMSECSFKKPHAIKLAGEVL